MTDEDLHMFCTIPAANNEEHLWPPINKGSWHLYWLRWNMYLSAQINPSDPMIIEAHAQNKIGDWMFFWLGAYFIPLSLYAFQCKKAWCWRKVYWKRTRLQTMICFTDSVLSLHHTCRERTAAKRLKIYFKDTHALAACWQINHLLPT